MLIIVQRPVAIAHTAAKAAGTDAGFSCQVHLYLDLRGNIPDMKEIQDDIRLLRL